VDGGDPAADELALSMTTQVLGAVRRAKTAAKRSMRAAVDQLVVVDTPERLDAVRLVATDLREAGSIADLVLSVGAEPAITVSLREEPAP